MTGSVDQIPKATTEWTAQPGDTRRATLSILRQPALWKRLLAFTTVVAAIAAGVCFVNGSGWLVGRRGYSPGLAGAVRGVRGRGQPGVRLHPEPASPAHRIAVGRRRRRHPHPHRHPGDHPDHRPRQHHLVRPAGALIVLRVRPKQVLGIPTALFADPALEGLIA
ncbi:hypothetical protein H7H51_22125 [Mycolicibacterium farcinogenes]|nr:hypothetical protein [Mycolicibacterium farcinogenes]